MSNLLEKASIVTTPTAYENGKILSVKPEPGLGSQLVTNGDFATDTDWTKGTGWTISGGVATANNVPNLQRLQQGLGTSIIGSKYKYSINISNVSGFYSVYIFGVYVLATSSTEGIIEGEFTATSTNGAFWVAGASASGLISATIDNVSVKQEIDGDFDFTRNSSATRVNSQGLIEDVQILSSNLVSNGDFSQEGSELITNGGFDSDSDWNKINSTISGGSGNLNGTGVNSMLYQNILTNGKTYKVTFTVSDYNSLGQARVIDNSGSAIYTITSNGTFTFTFTHSNANGNFFFRARNGAIYSIDNVSVKELGQDWTLGTGWSIGDDKVIGDGTMGGNDVVRQLINFSQGTTYRFSFTVLDYVSGGVFVRNPFNGYLDIASANGNYSFDYVAGINDYIDFRGNSFVGSISNISVIEITSDTNLPRIDYTGGVGHWLFEPQSTNLITQSQLLNSALNLKVDTTITDNYGVSPTGEANSSRIQFADTTAFCYAAVSVSTDHTASVYVKGVSGETVRFGIGANVTTGGLFTFNGLWQRINFTASSAAQIFFSSYSGATTSDFEAFGLQLEALSFATSYIPTNGSTVTRLQDAAFGAGSSDLINSTEGVLYAEIASFVSTDASDPNRYITITNGTSNQRIALLFGGNPNQLRAIAYSNTQSINLSFTTSLTDAKQFNKLAIKYKSGDYAFFLNGIKIGGSTEANIFTADTLNDLSFNVGGGTQKFRGKVKCVAVFKEALTDAELTCLTTI